MGPKILKFLTDDVNKSIRPGGAQTTARGPHAARQSILCGPPTLAETFIYLILYDRGAHTYRTKEPKTLEAVIERAATQFLV